MECTGDPVASTSTVSHTSHTYQTYPHTHNHDARPTPPINLRARRRLRKCAPKNLWANSKRGSLDSASTASSSPKTSSPSLECGGRPLVKTPLTPLTPQHHMSSCERPTIPMPTNLSDAKWLEYIERSGLMSSPELPYGLGSRAKVSAEPTPSMLSDFSNLTLTKTTSRQSLDSSSSLQPSIMSKPRKSISKRSLIGPAFKFAQMDGLSPKKKEKDFRIIKRKASVELIADQYQAFLESRDAEEEERQQEEEEEESERQLKEAKHVETVELIEHQAPRPQETTLVLEPTRFDPNQLSPKQRSPRQSSSRQGSLDRPRETLLEAPTFIEPSALSPASDGTLVAFEEDAIYFKPVSFSDSPEPSPRHERMSFDKPLPKPPSDQGTTPLGTSIAMLSKELTSAMPQQAPGFGSQSLQISVMIEAYERLRDQVDVSGMDDQEQRSMRSMFDSWLAGLHTVQRSFARGSHSSERRVEE